MDWKDVWMSKLGSDLDLTKEALPADLGDVHPKDLYRDFAATRRVLGQVDRGHPAMPDLPLEHVALAKSGLETGELLGTGHGTPCSAGAILTTGAAIFATLAQLLSEKPTAGRTLKL
jgi:hypothetical protein